MREVCFRKEDVYRGDLILVNEDFALKRQNAVQRLVPADSRYPEVLLGNRAASMLACLIREICGEAEIIPVSGYRSFEEQTKIYEDALMEHGESFTRKYVALPDHSEHQTGLAIDVGQAVTELDFICPEFPYEGICQKFREKAPRYGFVERYGKEKENVTKIGWEPWHFRYVGVPHARFMKEHAICLEEYIELIRQYPYPEKALEIKGEEWTASVSYLRQSTEEMFVTLPEDVLYQVSGNNVDGFILTVWSENTNGE